MGRAIGGGVAQRLALIAHNGPVVGSSPTAPTINIDMSKPKLPPEEVLNYLKSRYKYLDGEIVSLYGYKVGNPSSNGLAMQMGIKVGGRKGKYYNLKLHHVVWLFCKGEWPSHEIDHKDRNPFNNLIENLRLSDNNINQANRRATNKNKKNVRGVYKVKNGWQVQLWKDGKRHVGKWYRDRDEAYKAFLTKYKELWGVDYE